MSPLSGLSEVKSLLEAGADEFYGGILPEELYRDSPNKTSLNCHPRGFANFSSFEELAEAAKIIHDEGKEIFITFNAPYFAPKDYESLDSLISRLKNISPDALIVANPGLIVHIRNFFPDMPLHLSVQAGVFNSQSVEYFSEMGVSRIVFPDHLPLSKVESVIEQADKNLEFEIFVKNNLCRNLQSFCGFSHWQKTGGVKASSLSNALNSAGYFLVNKLPRSLRKHILDSTLADPFLKKHGCNISYSFESSDPAKKLTKKEKKSLRDYTSYYSFYTRHKSACGACGVYRAKKIGVSVFKIDGRHLPLHMKVRDVSFIREAIDRVNEFSCEKDYCQFVKNHHKKTYGSRCSEENCYFPNRRIG